MGAQPITFAGLAGMGDLHRHLHEPLQSEPGRRRGSRPGPGKLEDILAEMHMVAEGVKTATVALELAEQHGLDLPICTVIDKVVKGAIDPLGAYWGLTPAGTRTIRAERRSGRGTTNHNRRTGWRGHVCISRDRVGSGAVRRRSPGNDSGRTRGTWPDDANSFREAVPRWVWQWWDRSS